MGAETIEDAFAVFGINRRPLVDEEALKETYLKLAADRHPDASGGDQAEFHLVQEAYKTLRDPTRRLRHLLELAFPAYRKDGGHMPTRSFSCEQEMRSKPREASGSALRTPARLWPGRCYPRKSPKRFSKSAKPLALSRTLRVSWRHNRGPGRALAGYFPG